MKTRFATIILTFSIYSTLYSQEQAFYFFDANHLKSSIRQELGMSLFSHWTKSSMVGTFTQVSDGIAYPEPVFSRAIGIMSFTYEPKVRLIEYKSAASITLDIPLTGSLSLVDILTGSKKRFDAKPLTDAELRSGIFSKERSGTLGGMHVEAAGLISLNVGQGATLENTRPVGLSLGIGYNVSYGPLVLNVLQNYERKDYRGYLAWITPVGRVGFHFDQVVVYYMFGYMPTRVNFQTNDVSGNQSILTNTYNRLSLSFRLGR